MIDVNNINRPAQDGQKREFLCGDCEQIFSKRESVFATNVFNRREDNNYVIYSNNDDIRYAMLSMAWRSALAYFEDGLDELRQNELDKLKDILEEWRHALYEDNKSYIREVDMYLVPAKLIRFNDQRENEIFTYYAKNSIDSQFWCYGIKDDDVYSFSYIKVPYFMLITFAWGKWKHMKSYKVGNKIKARNVKFPDVILDLMNSQMEKSKTLI